MQQWSAGCCLLTFPICFHPTHLCVHMMPSDSARWTRKHSYPMNSQHYRYLITCCADFNNNFSNVCLLVSRSVGPSGAGKVIRCTPPVDEEQQQT